MLDQIWFLVTFCSTRVVHFPQCLAEENEKQKPFLKTKSRACELHSGTDPSYKLQMVFENGANEVRDLDLLLAQNGKCLVGEECQAYLQM